jgi:hypothetical protein
MAELTLTELSGEGRHVEIAYEGNRFAWLHCGGRSESGAPICRVYFEGDVRPEVMREILDHVMDKVVSTLPGATCIVYRAHLVARYGHAAR